MSNVWDHFVIVDGPVPYDILSISNPKMFRMFACFCQLQKKRGPFKVETLAQTFFHIFSLQKKNRVFSGWSRFQSPAMGQWQLRGSDDFAVVRSIIEDALIRQWRSSFLYTSWCLVVLPWFFGFLVVISIHPTILCKMFVNLGNIVSF